MSALVQRLTDAATAAIANERPALEHPVGRVVGHDRTAAHVEILAGPEAGRRGWTSARTVTPQ